MNIRVKHISRHENKYKIKDKAKDIKDKIKDKIYLKNNKNNKNKDMDDNCNRIMSSDENIFVKILVELGANKRGAREYSPLVLAYLGDAIYELFVRTMVIAEENAPVYKLHKHSTDFVKAKAQSRAVHKILEFLTQEEQEIVRRGRNAKPGTVPKNADIMEYKYATGLEALLGYLYLKQDYIRLMQVLKMCTDVHAGG